MELVTAGPNRLERRQRAKDFRRLGVEGTERRFAQIIVNAIERETASKGVVSVEKALQAWRYAVLQSEMAPPINGADATVRASWMAPYLWIAPHLSPSAFLEAFRIVVDVFVEEAGLKGE